jgi:hypothetical protein
MKRTSIHRVLLILPLLCLPAKAQTVDQATVVMPTGKHPAQFHLHITQMGPEITDYKTVSTSLVQQISKVKDLTPTRFGVHYMVPGGSK